MKTNLLQKLTAMAAVAGVTLAVSTAVSTAVAEDATAPNTVQSAAAGSEPVPDLTYSALGILKLAQAKLSDDTIIYYIKNSGNSYVLNADQIIYLRQQGVSEAVIKAMLSQPRTASAVAMPTSPAPQPVVAYDNSEQDSQAAVAPTVTYVQPAPDTTYYSQPYYDTGYQPYYYYPAYNWCAPVIFYHGGGRVWGGGWHGVAPGAVWHGGRTAGAWHGGGSVGVWHGGGHVGSWQGSNHR